MIVQCPNCLKRYRMKDGKASMVRVRCKSCDREFLVSSSKKSTIEVGPDAKDMTAVMADIQREFRQVVVEILRRQGFHLFIVEDGENAYKLIREQNPRLLFVNPYLPRLMGVELISKLRDDGLAPLTVFLMGAIHNSRRYRRRPESLYGADDYLEEGTPENVLLEKLRYHLNIPLLSQCQDAPEENEAYRLARAVFADLLVYEPERMENVKGTDDFFQVFRDEAKEGIRYIEDKAPGKGDLLRTVVSNYLNRS
jgi:predicted Zn finger-like uncharacterized protein